MEASLAPGMRLEPLWQTAIEKQLEAIRMIDLLFSFKNEKARQIVEEHGFDVDRTILKPAAPFVWTRDSIQAVLAASRSIPLDTKFTSWTFNSPAVWWYFEEPLPFKTLELPEIAQVGVRALCFGWMKSTTATTFDGEQKEVEPYPYIGCSAWCDSLGQVPGTTITPSQTWVWNDGYNLRQILENSSWMHFLQYGPTGRFRHMVPGKDIIGHDAFMAACEGLSKFVLAGLAWLDQEILVQSEERLERHRRKDFNRRTGQDIAGVRLVSLRKVRREEVERADETTKEKREWSCQWEVDGHWRNQACGAGMKDHKLIWISPYLKGPEDKPFKTPKRKVYLVNR